MKKYYLKKIFYIENNYYIENYYYTENNYYIENSYYYINSFFFIIIFKKVIKADSNIYYIRDNTDSLYYNMAIESLTNIKYAHKIHFYR